MVNVEVTCDTCKKPVQLSSAYRRVTGWERVTRQGEGGTNAVRCRKPSEVFACQFCVDREASGRAGQESLL